ncbi:MAG TPA: sigma-54 dependent transcriptional regulator [Candidatus Hydrogenedentes bacterium]|nr:sigma-54 dependent transcriptional regulator [Candidatus Hydrogenedentota bacterium]HNT89294.1 sigma-54 dependent transcriptional regulator [Candidatus Hydrogenedentota bacterium]
MSARILLVDDEKLIRWSLRERLMADGHQVFEAEDIASALRLLKAQPADLALIDLKLPDGDGIQLMRQGLRLRPDMTVLIITAHSSVQNAVEAIKAGAYDYVSKPFDMDELSLTVRRALENQEMRRTLSAEIDQKKKRFGVVSLIGDSDKFRAIKDVVCRVAASDSTTVLLLGPTGSGKDMIARAIHYESARVEKPFMNITCTAMPETLIESELFGYEEGAFTNATGQKAGLFELAHNGTVFLDEIGDMPPNLQAKLLRVLEEKTFRRIGGTADIHVDCRVVAATNRDLARIIEEGKFREDLYYRLSTVPILVPPLRERASDIPQLAQHFLEAYERKLGRTYTGFSEAALEKLLNHPWPGNVRELRNVIERAVLLSPGETIEARDVVLGRIENPAATRHPVVLPPGGLKLSEVERSLVEQALERTEGNQTQAAALLGITRDQVRYKLEKFHIATD